VDLTAVAVLEATDLYRFFHAEDDEIFALRGVSLHVDAGEIVAIHGPSGSGKSTLLHCLAGLDEPDAGTVVVAGQRLTRRPDAVRAKIRARHIGLLFQADNLIEHLDVVGNVTFACRLTGRHGEAPVRAALAAAGIGHRRAARPATLSGGEQTRAALAVALVNGPALILADEPTAELDTANAAQVLDVLQERAANGAAVVIVTHDPIVAGRADRHLTLVDGRLRP
jgi:putative ABC transport system ATP-binding protein